MAAESENRSLPSKTDASDRDAAWADFMSRHDTDALLSRKDIRGAEIGLAQAILMPGDLDNAKSSTRETRLAKQGATSGASTSGSKASAQASNQTTKLSLLNGISVILHENAQELSVKGLEKYPIDDVIDIESDNDMPNAQQYNKQQAFSSEKKNMSKQMPPNGVSMPGLAALSEEFEPLPPTLQNADYTDMLLFLRQMFLSNDTTAPSTGIDNGQQVSPPEPSFVGQGTAVEEVSIDDTMAFIWNDTDGLDSSDITPGTGRDDSQPASPRGQSPAIQGMAMAGFTPESAERGQESKPFPSWLNAAAFADMVPFLEEMFFPKDTTAPSADRDNSQQASPRGQSPAAQGLAVADAMLLRGGYEQPSPVLPFLAQMQSSIGLDGRVQYTLAFANMPEQLDSPAPPKYAAGSERDAHSYNSGQKRQRQQSARGDDFKHKSKRARGEDISQDQGEATFTSNVSRDNGEIGR